MAQQVQSWIDNDGNLFSSQHEAIASDIAIFLEDCCDKSVHIDRDLILDLICRNPDKIMIMLKPLAKRHWVYE